jgi:general secretion pathway protein G
VRGSTAQRGDSLGRRGFTLLELLIVMAIIGILVSTTALVYRHSVTKAKEAALKQDLYHMRECINQYFADRGKYPASLQNLVDAQYLREIPRDPFTETNESWEEVPYQPPEEEEQDEWGSEEGYGFEDEEETDYGGHWGDEETMGEEGTGIWDVKSGSKATALDGSSYSEW